MQIKDFVSQKPFYQSRASIIPALLSLAVLAGGASQPLTAQERLTPGGSQTRQVIPTKSTAVVRKVPPKFDYSGIGGTVFATGLGEVTVTVHHVREFLSDKADMVYPITVSAILGNERRLLGSNREHKTVRLGRLPRGEIVMVANCPTGDGVTLSGAGERNVDRAPRSRVKQVSPGVLEVYFEGTIAEGTRNDRKEQHAYKDFKLTFTGAVTSDSGLITLLDKIHDKDPQLRQTAREALKLASPLMASQAGIR